MAPPKKDQKKTLQVVQSPFEAFLDTSYLTLSKTHRWLLFGAIAVAPIAAFAFLHYMPTIEETSMTLDAISKLESDVKRAKADASKHSETKKSVGEYDELFRQASVLLPKDTEIPSLLIRLTDLEKSFNLTSIVFEPAKAETPKDYYNELPIKIVVQGSYNEIGQFLASLTELNRVLSVTKFKIEDPKEVNNDYSVKASLEVVIYRFTDTPLEVQNGPAKAK